MPRGKRASGQTHISISLPIETLLEIDQCADDDNRTRSNWIVNELEKRLAAIKSRKQLDADAPRPFPSTASPALLPEPAHRLNDAPAPARESAAPARRPVTGTRKKLRAMIQRETKSKTP